MVYDATGRQTLSERYYSDLVLSNNVPARILHADGVIELSSTFQPTYYYHLKDHLGNVRAVVSPGLNNTTAINQTNEYYPFGMSYTKSSSSLLNPVVPNKYKYNGKEEQEMPGKWLDYGARFYDPALGRWTTKDPLCEDGGQESVTPYGYVFNDPIKHYDPDGRFPVWAVVGAALDYGFQVYDNYQNGSSGYNAWVGDVNFLSVGLSTINPSGKFMVLKTLTVEGLKASTENSTVNDGVQFNSDAMDVATKTVLNTAIDIGIGKITEAGSSQAVKNSEKEVSSANKQLKNAERKAERSPNSTKKAEKVETAKSDVQVSRNNQVRTEMLNSTVGSSPQATQQAVKTTSDRLQKDEKK
jgi:RHS repeat-associated protein